MVALEISFAYAVLQMEATGGLALDIILEQFNIELVVDDKTAQREINKKLRQKRLIDERSRSSFEMGQRNVSEVSNQVNN